MTEAGTRVPRWALVLLLLCEVAIALPPYSGTPWFGLAGALLVPPVAVALLLRGLPLAALGVCALASTTTAVFLRDALPAWLAGLGVALCLLSGLAGYRIARAAHAMAVVAAAAIPGIALDIVVPNSWSTALVLLALCTTFPLLFGRSLRQQAALGAAAAEEARLRERTRIAHDMHDTLGHELSLLAMRAGALELASDVDERHRPALTELRAGAGAAIERLAEIVSMLRGDAPAPLHPPTEPIEALVARATDAGMTVRLRRNTDRDTPADAATTIYRVVREALTNAAKHAPAAQVQVTVEDSGEWVVVTVTNELTGGHGTGGGVGLLALDERLRLAGGTLRSGARDGVFEVVAAVPGGEAR